MGHRCESKFCRGMPFELKIYVIFWEHYKEIAWNTKFLLTCDQIWMAVASFLRYGWYCGVLYNGCHGEAPCNGLDRCCKDHDDCMLRCRNYLEVKCNEKLLDCMRSYSRSGQPQFKGSKCRSNTVEKTIQLAIKAGLWFGRRIPPQDTQNSSGLLYSYSWP